MYAWSDRPHFLHLALFFLAYVLGCGFAQVLAIVPGITVSIWPPGGVFIATLILTSPYSWPWWILSGCLAEMTAQFLWFHSPLVAGFLIYVGNALCAVVGATLVNRAFGRPVRLETLREVLVFVGLGAGVAPLASATVGSAALAWFGVKSQTFASVWPLFWIGDATGILLVAPPALVAIQHWRNRTQISAMQWAEAGVLGVIFLGIAALALKYDFLLSAYIIMPPILWAAVRFEFKGVAVALSLLALATMALTLSGGSQFIGDAETQRQKQVMLQLFLAISAFSALIVAAISRQHQQALLSFQHSERSLRGLLETLPTCVWCTTPDGKPTYFSPQFRDFVGFNVDEEGDDGASRLSNILKTIIHPDDLEAVKAQFAHSLATGEPYAQKHRLRRFDGKYRWVETRANAMRNGDGAIVQWNGVFLDLDDQVRFHNEVQEREARIRRLVDSDIIGITIWDMDGSLIEANDAFLDMIQYDRADLQAGLRWFDMLTPEGQEEHVREETEELARTGKMQPHEKELFRKDGSRVPALVGAALFEGRPTQGVAYILDVSERKRAEAAQLRVEEELRRSQLHLQQLVDTVPVMIDCAGPDGEPIYRSRRLREFLGYELEELDGEGKSRLAGTLDAGVHPDDLAGVKEGYARSLATGEPYARIHRLRRFDGEYRWVDTRAVPMRDADGVIVQWNITCLDIDGEVRAQQKLRLAQERLGRASQLASLAELSASIAHEVNQPLAAIVANSLACNRWLSAEPPNLVRAKLTAERIIRDANSAADVVSRIRALFKQSSQAKSATSLGSAVAEALALVAEEAEQRRVRIDTDIENDLPPVSLDRVQVQQVLINLIRNGLEAMDSTTEDRVLGIRAHRLGDLVQTEISDHGPGVAVSGRIFEPFFTTKGNGMGMGLTICRSIVESRGGRLWADKTKMHGARFIFTLPIELKAAP
jgi:PAS domain S-box-containing protein